jgi:hypothetical protein
MLHIDMSSGDLLNKLEAVRLLCQETGCAQRYLAHDALGPCSSRPAGWMRPPAANTTPASMRGCMRCRTPTCPSASP